MCFVNKKDINKIKNEILYSVKKFLKFYSILYFIVPYYGLR